LISEAPRGGTQPIPLMDFAEAGAAGHFDDAGFPAGKGWDEIAFPQVEDEHAYALEISGASLQPVYRDGTVIVVSPKAPVRRGDRIVVKTRGGELTAAELKRKTSKTVELKPLNERDPDRALPLADLPPRARRLAGGSQVAPPRPGLPQFPLGGVRARHKSSPGVSCCVRARSRVPLRRPGRSRHVNVLTRAATYALRASAP